MTQRELNITSHGAINTVSTNDQIFSQETNSAVDQIVSLAEASTRYEFINRQTHGVTAFARHLLGSIGVEIGSNVANNASELVRLRALTASNDDSSEYKKAA